jgi:hypothetical protein
VMDRSGQRTILLVTSGAPPLMLADAQRARMLCYDLPKLGWDCVLLVPSPEFFDKVWLDPEDAKALPKGIEVIQVKPAFEAAFRLLGIGTAGWRALLPLYWSGLEILESKKIDLIYITTTQFNFFCLGRWWHRKTGVPIVYDFHDPWYLERRRYKTSASALKTLLADGLSRFLEPYALRLGAGVVSVSPNYLTALRQRYPEMPCLQPERTRVIPFPATRKDFATAAPIRAEELRKIVYVGAGGDIMRRSFEMILQCLARVGSARPNLLCGLAIEIFGTFVYWKEGDPKPLEELAESIGLRGLVREYPARIGYSAAIELIRNSDGLLILGVDDPAYQPSKLFTYAFSGKPLLACLHDESQARSYFERFPGLGELICFREEGPLPGELERVEKFVEDVRTRVRYNRASAMAEELSESSAQRHVEFFESLLESVA